jgi:hypothetical protein
MSGEFRVDRIPCRRNSVSTEFRVDGIPCQRNSVSTKFRVDRIPFRWGNSVSTEFHGYPGVHLVEKKFKKCFYCEYLFILFFKNALAD